MRTYVVKGGGIERRWLLIDAEGKVLGRLASEVASLLRGKLKPTFTPSMDVGDNVVIVNAEKVKLTGNKREQKVYYSHSRYPGGLKVTSAARLFETKPEEVLRFAVRRMLPKNRLGRAVIELKIYAGPEHPHDAQNPEPYELQMSRSSIE